MSGSLIGPGSFFAVVGPSGAGKDTLLRMAAEQLGDGVYFPRRVVTRPADPQLEDHDRMSVQTFAAAQRAGDFALWWEAHGLSYGVPRRVDTEIAEGRAVACNVSRGAIGQAGARYQRVVVVLITAPRDVLAQRLAGRGRETAASIERRLARYDHGVPAGFEVRRIDNGGAPEVAAAHLVQLLSDGSDEVRRRA